MSKVKDLNGREVPWDLSKHSPLLDDTRPRSEGHLRARTLLKSLYSTDRILEEIPLPINPTLYLDFYLPFRKLAVEVQGQQHFKYIPHFHESKAHFFRSVVNDKRKFQFCEINGLHLAILNDEQADEQWTEIIRNLLQ